MDKSSKSEDRFGEFSCDADFFVSVLKMFRFFGLNRGLVRRYFIRSLRKKGYDVIDAEIRGIKYRLYVSLNPTDAKIFTSSSIYDKREIDFLLEALKPRLDRYPSVFLDVGANTGYYSLNMIKGGFSRCIAIEANPRTLDILKFNTHVNGFGDKLIIIPTCIGTGEDAELFFSGDLGSVSVFSNGSSIDSIRVKTRPLIDILAEQKIDRIDAMKIDIEGFEDRCLFPFFAGSAFELWPRYVVIEHCNRDQWEMDILQEMLDLGYVLKGKTRGNSMFSLV